MCTHYIIVGGPFSMAGADREWLGE